MLQMLSDYWSYAVGLLGLGAALSWIPGGGVVMGLIVAAAKAAAALIESIAPLLAAIFQGFIWIWQEVVLPTILDIFDNFRTPVGVAMIVLTTIGGTMIYGNFANGDIKYRNLQANLNACRAELRDNNRPTPTVQEEPLVNFNPFSIFKIF